MRAAAVVFAAGLVFASTGPALGAGKVVDPKVSSIVKGDPAAPLPVYALPGALDAVLALDRPGMLAAAYVLHEFTAGSRLDIGPFRAETRLLPHWLPNAGIRLAAGDRVKIVAE